MTFSARSDIMQETRKAVWLEALSSRESMSLRHNKHEYRWPRLSESVRDAIERSRLKALRITQNHINRE